MPEESFARALSFKTPRIEGAQGANEVGHVALPAGAGCGDAGVGKDGVNMRQVEILNIVFQPQREWSGIFKRLAPLPSEEDSSNTLIDNPLSQSHRYLTAPVGIGRGDQYFCSFFLQGAAHRIDGLTWATIARRHRWYDVQNFPRGFSL